MGPENQSQFQPIIISKNFTRKNSVIGHKDCLAIGTFGNNLKENTENHSVQGSLSSSHDHLPDITAEEVVELQKELTLVLHQQVLVEFISEEETEPHIPLDNFHCPSTLEDDKTNSNTAFGVSNDKDGHLQDNCSLVLNREKDIRLDHANNAIGRKSLSFLLKKMFLCRSGFTPAPSLRETLPESRMEKAIAKKNLLNRYMSKTDSEDEMLENASDGSKWVKTDSEFIVLEI
ncbi:hypothetical protein F0562_009767 [Nyssa sinensis]|uniref:Uncharacterized protein n=1 Tax=Nyssa sinensis TaxID=561372 RepID=A0A5J4ZZL4_9ASTE|nr:hypothetical protein F0562_009767 [Nyssa sinensis]